ncbi:ATP-binding protein [Piscinibacter sakaiensis]|uniref:ATP-binding protein n=1 Tax=Piscinibacter sakaiensis TaxID=1547922 RepID=UPI003AAAA022
MTSTEQQQLVAAIEGLEAQRVLLGDAVVDAALGPMRSRLAELAASGASAPAPGQAAEALRLVTVLFTDIVGSTQIAQQVDAEDMLELSSDALACLSAVVDAHGGRVLRYTGDGLKAVFGADAVHEDDAERAVACGLALQAEAGRLADRWRERWPGFVFSIRVGIHSGQVALGGGIEGGSTAMGSTVNLAARMEQAAAVGSVRISHDTQLLVRGRFDLEAQPALQMKGFSEPMRSYRVVRALPHSAVASGRGVEGLPTRMIGRDAELGILQQACTQLVLRRRLAVISIVAEPGIGKSRLLQEFEHWRRSGQSAPTRLLRGRATPQTENQPFGLLRDLLATCFAIADDDDIATARQKFEQAIVPLFVGDDGIDVAEGHAHLLGHLIGIDWRDSVHLRGILDDPRQIRNRALHAAAQSLRKLSAIDGAPIVVELDDLHWADNDSLDFLDYLFDVGRDLPLLVIALYRGTLFERRPDWLRAVHDHQRIDLAPLDDAASIAMADQLLRRLPEIPDALRQRISGDAGGNPYYMEELVNMLIDQRAILVDESAEQCWRLDTDRMSVARLPPTLTGVLQARLDGLPAAERLGLQQASIVGAVFRDAALAAVDETAPAALPALVRRELALPRHDVPDADDGDAGEYAFRHQMLHQATYATVLKRTRREQHGRLARWLAAQTGLRANDSLAVTALHFELAGNPAEAAEFHARAAEYAGSCLAHDAVGFHVGRGLLLLDESTDADSRGLRWRLLDVRERSLELQGDRLAQAADIDALERLAADLADPKRRAHAAWRRSVMAQRIADWPACEQAARQAIALATEAGADELRLLAMRLLGRSLLRPGDLASGAAVIRDALQQARQRGLDSVQSFCLNSMAVIAGMQRDPVAVLDWSRQDLAVNRRIGNRRGEAVGLSSVGCALVDLGQHHEAAAALEESLRLLRANGDRPAEAATLCSLSTVALREGDTAGAAARAEAAIDIAGAVQARATQAIALGKLGNARLAANQLEAAAQAYQASLELAVAIDDPVRHDATAGLASVALAAGQLGQALTLIDELLGELASGGTFDGAEDQSRIELSCFQVLAAAGDDRAGACLQRAQARLQACAAAIGDEAMRSAFIEHVPTHRDILSASLAAR